MYELRKICSRSNCCAHRNRESAAMFAPAVFFIKFLLWFFKICITKHICVYCMWYSYRGGLFQNAKTSSSVYTVHVHSLHRVPFTVHECERKQAKVFSQLHVKPKCAWCLRYSRWMVEMRNQMHIYNTHALVYMYTCSSTVSYSSNVCFHILCNCNTQ